MDLVRERTSIVKARNALLAVAVVVLLAIVITLFTLDFTTQRVGRSSLRIDTVQKGDLMIEVSGNGVLLPLDVEWIASRVEGHVAIIHQRAGDQVRAGQLLLELSSPVLVAAAEEALSALEGAKAEKLSYAVELQSQLLNQKSVVLQARFAYESAKLKLDAETKLREKSRIIADIDYRRTQLDVEQLQARYQIEQERLEKSKANIEAQLAAKEAYVMQLSKVLERANSKVEALKVTAGIDGVVQQMNIDVGQHLLPGSEIARVAQQVKLYAELKVQARQATDVAPGQAVLIDTRNGKVNGRVSRVDPQVTQGSVIVDVGLEGELPKGAKPELQVEGVIVVAELKDTLFVGKPSYSREDSEISVYRLDKNGEYAERIFIKTGLASVNHIQVLAGASPGDEIILSDSSDWQEQERILVN